MPVKAIVCVDKNWGIGYNGELLFHILLMKFVTEPLHVVENCKLSNFAVFLAKFILMLLHTAV